MRKLETVLSINNELVEKLGDISGLRAYISKLDADDVRSIYFVNCNDEVVATIVVEPEACQGRAFADITFINDLMNEARYEPY